MKLKVIGVCGMGLGTSLLLLSEVESIARKYGVEIEGEVVDLGSVRGKTCDVIISSSEIAKELKDLKIPIIEIKNMLDKREIEAKVKEFIESIRKS